VKPLRHDWIVRAVWLVMLPLAGLAGTIRVDPQARVEITNGRPAMVVQLFNSGDDAARILSVESDDGVSAGSVARTLAPGESCEILLPMGASSKTGCRQAVARIRYEDFGGVGFSSVVAASSTEDESWINLVVSPVSLGRSGRVRVSLCLLQDKPAQVTVRLVLPDEFDCPVPVQQVSLDPDSPRDLVFELTNRRGLPGGVYSLVAIAETETPGHCRSASASGAVSVTEGQWLGQSPWVWLTGALALLAALWFAGRGGSRRSGRPFPAAILDVLLLSVLSGFVLWNVSPADLMRNTTTVGGDTPAHLYLMSHLREQLFHHGRLISWAGGWWCGFPMFQYYFILPYLAAVLLGVLIPQAVAFKLVSVAGMVMTPLCAYWAARLWRLPRPVPMVMAMAMVPFLFVQSHTMWGVNTASTLAGMISNSWSFALLLPALASAGRDSEDGVIRRRTVFLMTLVLASHFFTSVMMFLSLAIIPVLGWIQYRGSGGKGHDTSDTATTAGGLRSLRVLFLESLLTVLLMAWWLVPLVAKSAFSVDFGINWDVTLWRSFPDYTAGLLVFAGIALVTATRSVNRYGSVLLLLWMLLSGVLLFQFGFAMSPVFVNVRLWPFVFFSLVALAAVGLGTILQRVRGVSVWLVALTLVVLLAVKMGDSLNGTLSGPGLTRSWARWNYSGLEAKPGASVFHKLVMPLKGTPGRLANDLCEENNQIGSSRVFELAPYLAGKAVLEGGLVNSALGSLYAYTIQGETSASCAGFPTIVTPQVFNFIHATRHLELFNVKHFIARGAITKEALRQHPAWRFVDREQEWELYELMSHEGRMVFIPPRMPVAVQTTRWKEGSLEWLTTPGASAQFVIWAADGFPPKTLDETTFHAVLAEWRKGGTNGMGPLLSGSGTGCIRDEEVTDDHIRFKTSAIGQPHIVKMSWFPNWKARGAARVYRVSPGFMLVFPEQESVELYYGTTVSDGVGYALTLLGCLGLIGVRRLKRCVC